MEQRETLDQLDRGGCGRVTSLASEGAFRRRMQDIGLIPGTRVTCLFRAPSGDPAAYEIRGAVIALRREDAGKVFLQRL